MAEKVNKMFLWFNNLPPSTKAFFNAFLVIIAFVVGAALEDRVQKIFSDQIEDLRIGLFWIFFLLLIAVIWGLLNYYYRHVLETDKNKNEVQRRVIEETRERVTKLTRQQLTDCDDLVESGNVLPDKFRSVLICDLERIKSLVWEAWEVINSHHNVSDSPTKRINFELTLITPSIRDNKLTVASWRNRDNLRPPSLNLRNEGNVDIYQDTEAAKMMANNITKTKIIEDTSEPSQNYKSLYIDQLTRIRSSVLHPILSPKSKPLGVIVLHCEVPKFFKPTEHELRYWHELLSVFASPIALEIERINAYNNANLPLSALIEKYQPY